jgi:hypothetical protein
VSQEKAEVTCNGKKKVVVERGEIRELLNKKFRDFL